MLANPRIVVLDEATSAIDSVTEARLQQALEILLRGRTAFVVAHRLSTIRKADLVLVMDQGRIVERGTHESLLRRGRCLRPVAPGICQRQTGRINVAALCERRKK